MRNEIDIRALDFLRLETTYLHEGEALTPDLIRYTAFNQLKGEQRWE